MKRRTLLTSLASAGAAAVAGCIDDSNAGGPGGNGTDTDDETDTDDGTDDGTTTDDGGDDGTFNPDDHPQAERFQIGSPEGVAFPDNNEPVPVNVLNDADEEREFTLRVQGDASGDSGQPPQRLLGPLSLDADAYATVTFNVPAEYTLLVDGNDETLIEYELTHRDFDCNSGFKSIQVQQDWSVETGGISTMMACPDPAARTVGVGQGEGQCAGDQDHAATVTYGETDVTVDGTFIAPTPCYSVSLAESGYDEENDVFRLVVEATENDVDTCTQCVGALDYELSLGFENDFPGHVSVVHRTNDGDVDVARATWNADVDLGK